MNFGIRKTVALSANFTEKSIQIYYEFIKIWNSPLLILTNSNIKNSSNKNNKIEYKLHIFSQLIISVFGNFSHFCFLFYKAMFFYLLINSRLCHLPIVFSKFGNIN